jgi:hypothetical protein
MHIAEVDPLTLPSLPLRKRSRTTGGYENSIWRELNIDIAVRHWRKSERVDGKLGAG